jgi:methionine-gamma-lyase
MSFNPAEQLEKNQNLGQFKGVNPSISDSATYTFKTGQDMMDTFEGKSEGAFLYSRHTSPSNMYLANALAAMEGTEEANVAASGMGAISTTILQICGAGDHIVSSRTIYGGSYAIMKNYLPKLNIQTTFVDVTSLEAIEAAIQPNTKMIYCEVMSNPLLEIANIPEMKKIAKKYNVLLVVDNTFTPLIMSPYQMGADIVIHSLTKFINGMNDTVGGVVCASADFINATKSVIDGAAMLIGSTMDSFRSASILKNTHTLAIRMKKHSENALYISQKLEQDGARIVYPGLASHKDHQLFTELYNEEFGFGGMITIDALTLEKANTLMQKMQERNLGDLAVSLGFYRTLFNAPGTGTSSEVPEYEQKEMGLSPGLVRFSMGLDHNIEQTYLSIKECMLEIGILEPMAV